MTKSLLFFQNREQSFAKNLNYIVKKTNKRDKNFTKITFNNRIKNQN